MAKDKMALTPPLRNYIHKYTGRERQGSWRALDRYTQRNAEKRKEQLKRAQQKLREKKKFNKQAPKIQRIVRGFLSRAEQSRAEQSRAEPNAQPLQTAFNGAYSRYQINMQS
eukprot:183484-Hanusia_phi.AAC.1